MQKKNVEVEQTPAPAITPDLLGKLRKEDMKQAVVERFKATSQPAPAKTKERKRSPYWQTGDEEC